LLCSTRQSTSASNIQQHGRIGALRRIIDNGEWEGDVGDAFAVDMNIIQLSSSD
jgi:hypothetical protein